MAMLTINNGRKDTVTCSNLVANAFPPTSILYGEAIAR